MTSYISNYLGTLMEQTLTHTFKTECQFAITPQQIAKCFPVIHELRPHFTEETFLEQVQRQQKQGYHFLYHEHQDQVTSIAGYRYIEFLAWGKVLYLDDLATHSSARRNGYASKLLQFVIEEAKRNHCNELHLDSGYQRHDAHKFYLKHGLEIRCHHFGLKLFPVYDYEKNKKS